MSEDLLSAILLFALLFALVAAANVTPVVRWLVRRRAERRAFASLEARFALEHLAKLEEIERRLAPQLDNPNYWTELTQWAIHDAAVEVGCLLAGAESGHLPKNALPVERLREKDKVYTDAAMRVYEALQKRGRNPNPPWALFGSSSLERHRKRRGKG